MSRRLFVCLFAAGCVVGGLWFFVHRHVHVHQATQRNAVVYALTRCLDRVLPPLSDPVASSSVRADRLHASLRDALALDHRLLPTFLASNDLLVATETVTVPSSALVVVARVPDGSLIGVCANRQVRDIPREELDLWPHDKLYPGSLP